MDKKKKKVTEKKQPRPSPAEKPISLHGPSFEDVMRALLDTKPMPKEKTKGKERTNG